MSGAPQNALPPRGGIGLKLPHFAQVLEAATQGAGPKWVEIHPQNYAMRGGPMHHWLTAISELLPISFHSVGLSIGDPGGIDSDELDQLAILAERYDPAEISDHLSWSSLNGERIPDLLPLPMTGESLGHFAAEVSRVQDRLKRRILIENPSRMLAFRGDDYDEVEFVAELCRKSGCGLLLDINNVIVSGLNLGFDPITYVDRTEAALVAEVHVAGHSVEVRPGGTRIAIDDHGSPVGEECWALLARFLDRAGPKPVLVERDNDVPQFAELAAEASRADALLTKRMAYAA